MTAHLLRLIWNRKRQNLLLSIEILLSFFVLFGVTVVAAQFLTRWRAPLGFDIERVWSVEVRRPRGGPGSDAGDALRFRGMFTELATMPQVEAAAGAFILPYSGSSAFSGLPLADGRYIEYAFSHGSDGLAEVLGIRLAAGRWFSAEDDGANAPPVVLNQRLARDLFGDRDAVGRTIDQVQPPNGPPIPPRLRVVGVIEDFRHDELSMPGRFAFFRLQIGDTADGPGTGWGPLTAGLPSALALRVGSGTTAAFEEALVRRLDAVAPGWTFRVERLTDMRRDTLRGSLVPLAVAAIVTFFLLVMVALGITGIVWQTIATRTAEFGLRRANGATAAHVRWQVVFELVLLTSLALGASVAILVQVPLLPRESLDVTLPSAQTWAASIAVSAAVIYLVTLLCGLYPSRLATRIQPADALRYE